MDRTYRPYQLGTEWSTTTAERDLESRVRQLELRATTLEATIEHRLAKLKAEIQTQISEDRLSGFVIVSAGVAVATWVAVILAAAR